MPKPKLSNLITFIALGRSRGFHDQKRNIFRERVNTFEVVSRLRRCGEYEVSTIRVSGWENFQSARVECLTHLLTQVALTFAEHFQTPISLM